MSIDSMVDGNDLYNLAVMVHSRADLLRVLHRRRHVRKDARLTAEGIGVGENTAQRLEKINRLVLFLVSNALKNGCTTPDAHILLTEMLYNLGQIEAAKDVLLASGAVEHTPEAQQLLKSILLEIGGPAEQDQLAQLLRTSRDELSFLEVDGFAEFHEWCASSGVSPVALSIDPITATRKFNICKESRIQTFENTITSSPPQGAVVKDLHLLFNVIPHSNGRGYYDQDILHRLQETFPVYASSKRRIAYASCAEKTTEFRGRYIVACASVTYYQHYFHLICQVLARILMALQCPEADGCGILLPAFVPQWGLEFLALAGVDKERITIMPRNHSARVEEALVLPLKWDVCPTEIAVARQLLSQRFPHDGDGVDYYLTRRGATNVSRSLSNEQEFIEILQARNFTIVDPLDHSLEEQMRLFSRARTIVSSGSSAYANMLYAPSGTRIILIAPSLFWGMLSTDLATACGHDFSVLFGEFLAGEQHTANPHRPYTADPVAFQKLLDLGSA